jgi:molybdopterin-guanine dinucleotide biosynthesis protein A
MQGKPTTDHPSAPRAAILLAGGRSLRMGGGHKALLPLGPGRVIDHVLSRLRPQCDVIALSANGDPAPWRDLGLPVLPDSLPDFPGPLAGVLAGMGWAAGLGADRVLTVAADTPFLPPDLWVQLAAGPGLRIAADGAGKIQPTIGLWPVSLKGHLRAALGRGERKVALWAMQNGATTVPFADRGPPPFFNINTPDDLAQATAFLSATKG